MPLARKEDAANHNNWRFHWVLEDVFQSQRPEKMYFVEWIKFSVRNTSSYLESNGFNNHPIPRVLTLTYSVLSAPLNGRLSYLTVYLMCISIAISKTACQKVSFHYLPSCYMVTLFFPIIQARYLGVNRFWCFYFQHDLLVWASLTILIANTPVCL